MANESRHVTIRVKPDMWEEFKRLCMENYTDRSKVLRDYMTFCLEERKLDFWNGEGVESHCGEKV